ncbi:MAG: hypothetical protein R3227_14490 [Reinekea sp.]|nr:hypothetical protein [Reinekea sp.]
MDIYQPLKTHFRNDKRVSVNEGKGAQGIKMRIKGKERMFAMFLNGDLLLQTSPEQVNALINQKLAGHRKNDAGSGPDSSPRPSAMDRTD